MKRRDDIQNLPKVCSPTDPVVKNESELKKGLTKRYFSSSDEQLAGSSKSGTITETEDWTFGARDLQRVIPQSSSNSLSCFRSQRAWNTIFLLFKRDSDNFYKFNDVCFLLEVSTVILSSDLYQVCSSTGVLEFPGLASQ